MNPEAERKRRLAMHRLAERARRISLIRKSVFAGAAATFALAWGLALNNQLAHGTKTTHDSGPTRSGDGIATTPSAPYTTPAPAPAPLTTSQS